MQPLIDTLEGRRMFAFTISNAIGNTNAAGTLIRPDGTELHAQFVAVTTFKVSKTGTLFLSTTGKADKVSLQVKNGKIVGGTGLYFTLGQATDGNVVRSTSITGGTKIKRIDISTLGGNDEVTVIADVPVSVRTAAGNDTLNIFAPTRTIEGGSGSNTIREGNEAAGDAYRPNLAVPVAGTYYFGNGPLTIDYYRAGAKDGLTYNFIAPEVIQPVRTSPRGG